MEWLNWKTPKIAIDIDTQAINFKRSGEFSLWNDEAFEKHLKRLEQLNSLPVFKNMNGRRIKELYRTEGLMYWRP